MISNVLEHAPRGKKVSEADILSQPGANTALELEQVMVRGDRRGERRGGAEKTETSGSNLISESNVILSKSTC